MSKLILLRHGQSEWNKLNLFTGWVDIPLSPEGIEQSYKAGELIAHIPIDYIFSSSLIRAQMTAMLAMTRHKSGKVPTVLHPHQGKLEKWAHIFSEKAEKECIPMKMAWELNERMYGELQGLNKQETIDQYGAEQVKIWRRSYDIPPPKGESLKDTAARAIPYFNEKIAPLVEKGKNVLIAAHGNSLRAIVMVLEQLSEKQILEFEIATGDPFLFNYKNGTWSRGTL
jgi:2,3-bisphosphoglycerate-dependent phosphoglycerate mutase